MSITHTLRVVPNFSTHTKYWSIKTPSADSFSGRRIKSRLSVSSASNNQNLIEKIRERITNERIEISPSAYDTAWVAMVPSREYSGVGQPCFPQCLDWIMENQNPDGSWGLNQGHPYLVKDSLSCTLACVLALRKWDVGQQLVQRGMDFIVSNAWAATHKDQISPIGFHITFPAMLNSAKELDLTSSLSPTYLDSLLRIRLPEISTRWNQEYAAEGIGKSCNWKAILKHQRSNGSLFNSPATTAAALIHYHDDKCFDYLNSALQASNRWVPTIFPMDIYTRLCVVDSLERLGVNQYFEFELGTILDEIYRCWLDQEDKIFSDVTCQAMAFRLLRTEGYDVSSDDLAEYVDQEHFFNTVSIQHSGVSTVLELYRASQVRICGEGILEKIHSWTSAFLRKQLLNHSIQSKRLREQVDYDLRNFYGSLDQFRIRRTIELYDAEDFQILKSAYRCPTVHNEDLMLLAVENFRISQARYQEELQKMKRWYAECGFDCLNQGRNTVQVTYVLTAAAFTGPELSGVRICYAQVVVLITCIDDFFDSYGSREEALSIIELVRKWDSEPVKTYCSEEVRILFTALYNTVNEVAAKAYVEQGFCVRHDLVRMWLELLTAFVGQKDWTENNISTLDEYLSSAWKSVGSDLCVLMPIHFLGTKIPEVMFKSSELASLCEHTSLVCRLLNDIKTFKREEEEGTLNSVSVQTGISEEEAILKVKECIEFSRRKVMQMAYESKESIVPRECKQVFWKTCMIAHCLYSHDGGDEYSSPRNNAKDMNAMMSEPLELLNQVN